MKALFFPPRFVHAHPRVRNVNEILDNQATRGALAADWVATAVGSWHFIVGQIVLLVIWALLNVTAWVRHWDPYPFILMNLFMSLQAAFTAPVIMMSQNRQSARDRLEAHNDFLINTKAEEEVRAILANLEAQNEAIEQIHRLLVELRFQDSDVSREPGEKNE